MDELLEQFLIEGPELVQQAGEALLALERRPDDSFLIDSAFRAVHTLKGSAGLFDYPPMGLLLHAAEDLLGAFRAGRRAVDRDAVDDLVSAMGQTDRWLAAIASAGTLPDDAGSAAERLVAMLRGRLDHRATQVTSAVNAASGDEAWIQKLLAMRPDDAPLGGQPMVAVRYVPDPACYFNGDDPVEIAGRAPSLIALHVGLRADRPALANYDPFTCYLVIELLSGAPLDEVKAAFRFVPDQTQILQLTMAAERTDEGQAKQAGPAGASRTLRVEVSRIDVLVGIVGELVVVKNCLAELVAQVAARPESRATAEALASRHVAIDRLVGMLHRAVVGVRLVPVTPLLRRLPRLVREMAVHLGKDVDLTVEGDEVEIDKSVLDGLFEPLTHLLRNAVDHGVEPAEQRRLVGKPLRASLRLAVRQSGDHVVIAVEDDGRGIDPAMIRQVAADRSVMTSEALGALRDDEVLDLIFMPGFSTAHEVTELSGRGVGMDAVRTMIGRLGGKVSLTSKPGLGTTVRLTLPLNLVLTKVLMVSCAGETYGVPMDMVVETVRVAADQLLSVRAGRVFVLRDQVVPLLHLDDLLHIPRARTDGKDQNALVIRAGRDLIGISVDAFGGHMDVLLRPMTGLLSSMPGVLGTTILGNGQVMMVLDLADLVG
ncbi:MAG TPA: chemotaxis protein CheA [Geminicoccus sp.]|jgi:two-component system chemotaxis sensor kinase CheA|uniref:chemotaxis protein CheA n=1 Tax=Geminicoccus sp. TaxID=2024832 RepID=UPI002E34B268|nr:chemotaxis protein CheA [Geminicoccus sp.]HEX2525441.1 chemotaxis protein CheA [Geminicoccus sp.]